MCKLSPFSKPPKMDKTYQDALALLDTRRRGFSPRWKDGQHQHIVGKVGRPALEGMRGWVEQLGYSDVDLPIIHVAGTKGKGTTCAFVSQFLQRRGAAVGLPKKIGLYTSPPLNSVRERIQINSKPVSEKLFTDGTFEVWNRLWSFNSETKDGLDEMPHYRQFLMLLSLHIFMKEDVDIAVYETHSGGQFDCTNVLHPIVTGITTIGMDHVRALGPSIEDIAWHKAGIFKSGAAAFSTLQLSEVAKVLKARADEKGVDLQFVGIDHSLPSEESLEKPDVLRMNASLAISLTNKSLQTVYSSPDARLSEADIRGGWNHFSWQGRFQHIADGQCEWFLDIAHNEISLKVATSWYAQAVLSSQRQSAEKSVRVLIFGQKSPRDMTGLLRSIIETLKESRLEMHYVIFTTLEARRDGTIISDFYDVDRPTVSQDDQNACAQLWNSFDLSAKVFLEPTIEDALDRASGFAEPGVKVHTFITGTDRLVGPALTLLTHKP